MSKKPKLRMTNADYVAIAISPALIMALVGSLVFFLIEVLYVGQYQTRLNYVFALFVFATVLIGRISIEMGAERAALFALPLGMAMFAVLAKFVPHANPLSHVINLGLLGLTWWSTHKLTWDCTLIDDSEDASGEGLMQQVGVDELAEEEESTATDNELLAQDDAKQKQAPHTPGLWVLYFSLAALPLFGAGQKWIPVSEVGRRQYAFGLLAIYVASGLTLLVTTSFLGLRRYLRQRRIEMPTPMAATWVVTGGVLIAVVMLLAALVPRPNAEYAISQLPWQADSPQDLASSRNSWGSDGTKDEEAGEETRKVTEEKTDPSARATREGDHPTTTTTSETGEKKTQGGEGPEKNHPQSSEQQGQKSDSEGGSKSSEASESKPQAEQPQAEQSSKQQSKQQSKQPSPAAKDSQPQEPPGESSGQQTEISERADEPSPEREPKAEQQESERAKQPSSDASPESSRPSQSLPEMLSSLGGLVAILKLAMYAVFAVAVGYWAWRNRAAIARGIAELIQTIREFLSRLFGGTPAAAEEVEDAAEKQYQELGPPFASFTDPFASERHRSLPPPELVRYTFEAFEAWARERGFPRSPDQTPGELIRQATPQQSQLQTEARRLAQLYSQAAYAPGEVSASAVNQLAQLWTLMRHTPQTAIEPNATLANNPS